MESQLGPLRASHAIDGGIRPGSDVVKGLALGARAVMIGRAFVAGLAANGQARVETVLDTFRPGVGSALIGHGRTSAYERTRYDIVVADGLVRALGAEAAR